MLELIFNWRTLWWIMMIMYIPVCLGLITIVLLQKGKGSGFAGAFGLGSGSEAVFGPRGSKSLPVRLTQVLAGVFMVLALLLSLTSGLASRGIAPDTIDPSELESAQQEGQSPEAQQGFEELEELGLGSAVEGGEQTTPPINVTPSQAPDEDGEEEGDSTPQDAPAPAGTEESESDSETTPEPEGAQ